MKQFSIRSLLLVFTLVAVAYTAWNQSKLKQENIRLRSKLDESETDRRVSGRINELLLYLHDRDDLDHLIKLRRLIPSGFSQYRDPELRDFRALVSNIQLVDVDGKPSGLEILSLSTAIHTNPGSSSSINVLFDDDKTIDIVMRSTGTRVDTHFIKFQDTDDDQRVELVVQRTAGFMDPGELDDLVYKATPKGFKLKQ